MNNVIFLDFDGVVNTIYWSQGPDGVYNQNAFKSGHQELNNKQAIGWLNELYNRIPYDVVVTSTWRLGMSVEELQNLLIKSGFDPRIRVIGKTPVLHTERGKEIQQWICETGFDGNFIIIDDDSDMCHLIDRLIQPNTYIGITMYDFRKAVKLFKNS